MDQLNNFNFQEIEHFFKVLMEHNPVLVCFKDKDGRWIFANKYTLELFGLTEIDYRGKTDLDLIEYAPFHKQTFEYCTVTDKISWENRHITKTIEKIERPNGEDVFLELLKIPLFHKNGTPKGLIVVGNNVTEFIEKNNRLTLKNQLLIQAEKVAKMGSWLWNINSNEVELSEGIKTLLNIKVEKNRIPKERFLEFFSEDEKKFLKENIFNQKDFTTCGFQRIFKKDLVFFRHFISCITDLNYDQSVIGIIQDITDISNMSYKLQLATIIFNKALEGVVITDPEGTIIDVNPAFTKITGYTKQEAIGKNPRILKSNKHPPEFYKKMWEDLTKKGWWEGEIWNRRKNKEVYPEILSIHAIKNRNGKTINYVSVFYDLTTQKRIEEESKFFRFYDPLTGLMNREFFVTKIRELTEKKEKERFCIIIADIDDFRQLNEIYSYTLGDQILIAKSKGLINLFDKEHVARIGEDTFAIIYKFNKLSNIEEAIRKMKSNSYEVVLEGIKLNLTCSYGISIYPDDATDANDLLRYAESALSLARKKGPGNYMYFNRDFLERSQKRFSTIEELKKAIEAQEFVPFYQPKVDASSGKIKGFEALVRWIKPDGSIVPPAQFIPLAEETELIVPMTINMARKIAKDMSIILKKFHKKKIKCAINLSVCCINKINWLEYFQKLSREFHIPLSSFEVEVTETMVMTDEVEIINQLNILSQNNITICLDDFGTGYSSLSFLKRLPVGLVKIDKSFINNLTSSIDDQNIVKAIIEMSKALGKKVCAEGVETQDQLNILRILGCDQIQGYYFSPPVNFESTLNLLNRFS